MTIYYLPELCYPSFFVFQFCFCKQFSQTSVSISERVVAPTKDKVEFYKFYQNRMMCGKDFVWLYCIWRRKVKNLYELWVTRQHKKLDAGSESWLFFLMFSCCVGATFFFFLGKHLMKPQIEEEGKITSVTSQVNWQI